MHDKGDREMLTQRVLEGDYKVTEYSKGFV